MAQIVRYCVTELAASLTVVRRSGPPKNQVRNIGCVFYGIMNCEEAAETSAADNDLFVMGEVLSQALDIIDDLLKCIRSGMAALAVPSEIKG
jgi:hypothetical protein